MVGMEELNPQEGVIETLKSSFVPETVTKSFDFDKNMIFPLALYGAIGFIAGFLIKKYSEYFITCALFVLGLIVLQQFEYIDIAFNTHKVASVLGLNDVPVGIDGYGTLIWEWARSNVSSAVSLAVGFLIGIKVG